jgi:hypothetical protein
MKSKIDLKGLSKAQLDYITSLEAEVDKYKNDGAKRLLSELSGIAGDFADDLVKIRGGNVDVSCKFITDDKNDMVMDRVLKLIDKMDKFKMLAQLISPDDEESKAKQKTKTIRRPEDLVFNGNR